MPNPKLKLHPKSRQQLENLKKQNLMPDQNVDNSSNSSNPNQNSNPTSTENSSASGSAQAEENSTSNNQNPENEQKAKTETQTENMKTEENSSSSSNNSNQNFNNNPGQNFSSSSNPGNSSNNASNPNNAILMQEMEDWKNRAVRLTADLQNLSRQHELEIPQARKGGKKMVAQSLLTFLTTLYLAFSFAPKTEDQQVMKFISTLKFSFDQLINDLKSSGVEILVPEIGQTFNPQFMTSLNTPEGDGEIKIKQVVGLGLRIDNQLIQASSVML